MTKEKEDNNRDDPMQIDSNRVPTGSLLTDYLRIYYGKFFPYTDMFKWLAYGNDGKHPGCDSSYFGRREFSFTINSDIDEVYLRFQSFFNASEMETSIKAKCPTKIDIGAVYTVDPAKRHAYAQSGFNPIERELVFDIDISDYDDVRYCCSGADTCLNCWPLMTIAIKVIDTALREDFGFSHILWVYSGRRGVHCWVCDSRARRLSKEQRSAIADYFHVYKGGENSLKKVTFSGPLHPFLARAYTDVLKNEFEKWVSTQKLFEHEERFHKILQLIPDESVVSELAEKWQGNSVRWEHLKHMLQSGSKKTQGLRRCIEEIVFSYTYPRLDIQVTKGMNHLLKAPFCVHPGTGRICIPIDPKKCEEFDPTSVPTVAQLIEELNANASIGADNYVEKTSLAASVHLFRTCFLEPLIKTCKDELENAYNTKIQQTKDSLNW
ncbi:DNA primase [Rhynchospora pubera]|uniref:DNA primase n=1 Tax=Rhynchospora pubera TaxID=906938 RepID=A0AAV8F6E4_9POAL|nr:DNA primase [Rhynchospora pubera]